MLSFYLIHASIGDAGDTGCCRSALSRLLPSPPTRSSWASLRSSVLINGRETDRNQMEQGEKQRSVSFFHSL